MSKKKAKVFGVVTLAAAVLAGGVMAGLNAGGVFSKAASLSSYFSTNASGSGKNASITIDGDFSDWDSSMLIAQGVANDDPRAFRGPHEGPVYDTYALYGSYDEDNLYLMWEITNLTDVVAPEQDYPQSDNGKPWNGDIPQIIALDIDPNKSADGTITASGEGVWGMTINYTDGTDALLCFSSKVGVGTPALFTMDANGGFSYSEEYCQGFKDLGISFNFGDGHISDKLYGIKMNGYTGLKTSMMFDDSAAWVDLSAAGHDEAQDTMYEMVIPLDALGIDKAYIEEVGIGVRHISTFGKSAIQSLPVDSCIYDNAEEAYSADESTSAEKEDDDVFSTAMARIGKYTAPEKTETPVTEEPATEAPATTAPATEAPETTAPATETPATTAPVQTGIVDNNDHSNEEAYTITGNGSYKDIDVKYAAEEMKNGTILHAWCWSFDTIRENMQAIKDAGYTSVQVSPIQNCVVGNGGSLSFEGWYYHYQPVGFSVGNYQLGTQDEFEKMCDVADEYGVRIIVDGVFNHTTSNMSALESNLQDSSLFHAGFGISSYDDRYQVTQGDLLGLKDLNTQSTAVQKLVTDYIAKCLSLGASGFRYDAAKHIELPSDDDYAGNFWPVISDNDTEFQYGEVLQDPLTKDAEYGSYMPITASSYGYALRSWISENYLGAGAWLTFQNDSPEVVTWVESHDNYTDGYESTQWMTNEQLKLGWAIIASRGEGSTPLFFSRPNGAGGTSYDSKFSTSSQIGDIGDDLFMDDEIAAVNLFRNAMEGETEYLRNPNEDTRVLMIERGTKGVVIVNSNYSSYSISSETNLADGTYTNRTDDGSTFTVKNGVITGTVPSRGVAVLYTGASGSKPNVGISGYSANSETVYRDNNGLTLTLTAENADVATYSINDGTSYKFVDGKQINIGYYVATDTVITVEVKAENEYGVTAKKYTFIKKDASANKVTFEKPSSWANAIYAYIYKVDGDDLYTLAAWPGTAMEVENGDYVLYIDDDIYLGGNIIFTDGTNQAPMDAGFIIEAGGVYDSTGLIEVITPTVAPTIAPTIAPTVEPTIAPTTEPTTAPTVEPTVAPTTEPTVAPTVAPTAVPGTETIVFEKPMSWNSDVYAYVYTASEEELAQWPGTKMTKNDEGLYTMSFESKYDYVIFTDGVNQSPAAFETGYEIKNNGYYTVRGWTMEYDPTPVQTTTPAIQTPATETPVTEAPATEAPEGNKITIYYYTGWATPNVHYSIGGGDWTTVPGVAMKASTISGYSVAEIDLGTAQTLTACFNDNNGSWDNNQGNDYSFGKPGVYTVKNGQITEGAPETCTANKAIIFYKTSWSAYAHYQVGDNDWTAVPGAKMSTANIDGYKWIAIDLGTATSIKLCFNDGNGNWDNNQGNDYYITTAGGTYTISDGNILVGAPGQQ